MTESHPAAAISAQGPEKSPRIAPFALVAYGLVFAGAVLLLVTPLLPLADVTLFDTTVDVRLTMSDASWAVPLLGLLAAAGAGAALARRAPLWAAVAAPAGLAAMIWSGWWVFVRLPELARLADSAALGWGGMAFVLSGPLLLLGGLAAVMAALQGGRR